MRRLMLFFFGVSSSSCFFFFFQAEDGIRDRDVTGVQTCALPISAITARAFVSYLRGVNVRLLGLLLRAIAGLLLVGLVWLFAQTLFAQGGRPGKIGRASCRERV